MLPYRTDILNYSHLYTLLLTLVGRRMACRLIMYLCVLLLAGCATSHAPKHHVDVNRTLLAPGSRNDVVLAALSQLGTPYRYGGSTPSTGFDCSGLIVYVLKNSVGWPLPRQTADIARQSRPVSRKQLKAGDFVFFNTLGKPHSHMGIYIGEGQFVNAPSSGGRVRIDSLDSPYFARSFDGAGTLFRN